MRPFLAALAALCIGLPALAQAPQAPNDAGAVSEAPLYRVEVVVFRATSALGSPEDWSEEAGGAGEGAAAPDADPGAGAAPAPAGQRGGVQLLPPSEFQLDRVAARLRSSGVYVPVAHAAWVETASPWGRPIEIPVQSLGIDVKGLTGTVALERGEFLHLALQLDYAMDDPPPGLGAAPGTVFTLHESHRVRLRKRNYFDHPAFGVIALVVPERKAGAARAAQLWKSRASAAQRLFLPTAFAR